MTLVNRADQVGSLLRPPSVTQAWKAFARGELDEAARRSVEDDAIRLLVHQQEETGIGVITDGEFRRDVWWSGFIPYVEGIELFEATQSPFAGNATEKVDARINGIGNITIIGDPKSVQAEVDGIGEIIRN